MNPYGLFNEKTFKEYSDRVSKGWDNEGWLGYNRTDGIYETWEPVVSFWVNTDKKIVPVTNMTDKVKQSVTVSLNEQNPYHVVGELDHKLFNAPPHYVCAQFGTSYEDISAKLAGYTEESLIDEFVIHGPLVLSPNGTNSKSGIHGRFIDSRGTGFTF